MNDEMYKNLQKRIVEATESRDVFNYAKAYSEIKKADAEQVKVDMGAIDQANRTEIERTKVEAEIENAKSKIENERAKIEADREANKRRSENERRKIESDERTQRYRTKSTSRDNAIMSGVFAAGYLLTFGCEIKGILLSKEIRSLSKLIRFH